MSKIPTRNQKGYSLIETMTVIAVLGIVMGLLYAYSNEGWKLFYQSYSRGLSQTKAKLAVKAISDELREANKARLTVGRGSSYGVPLPDDVIDNSPFIYFTKPRNYEGTGDVTAYNYILYYFAKPKEKIDPFEIDKIQRNRKPREEEKFLILKSIKFLNQSKYYTEDEEKSWPFQPPIVEVGKSTFPEDESYLEELKKSAIKANDSATPTSTPKINNSSQDEFLDHFAKIKKESRNIPISGNFTTNSLTDTFSKEDTSFSFSQSYTNDNTVKIKVKLEESPVLFGHAGAMSDFEISVTPRN